MIVDSSALLHVLFKEQGAEETVAFLTRQSQLAMAAPTVLETEIVYGAALGFSRGDVTEFISRLGIAIVPFDTVHVREAKVAYARFGKGQGHKAQLNLGDCVTYALAKVSGRPVVFKGDDFTYTDLELRQVGVLG